MLAYALLNANQIVFYVGDLQVKPLQKPNKFRFKQKSVLLLTFSEQLPGL